MTEVLAPDLAPPPFLPTIALKFFSTLLFAHRCQRFHSETLLPETYLCFITSGQFAASCSFALRRWLPVLRTVACSLHVRLRTSTFPCPPSLNFSL
eukprot:6195024-Pleurochrysis_carterae.AAC.2